MKDGAIIGEAWEAALFLSDRKRPSIPKGPPTTAKAATPRPIFARKLRRDWPDFSLGSISLAKLFSSAALPAMVLYSGRLY